MRINNTQENPRHGTELVSLVSPNEFDTIQKALALLAKTNEEECPAYAESCLTAADKIANSVFDVEHNCAKITVTLNEMTFLFEALVMCTNLSSEFNEKYVEYKNFDESLVNFKNKEMHK